MIPPSVHKHSEQGKLANSAAAQGQQALFEFPRGAAASTSTGPLGSAVTSPHRALQMGETSFERKHPARKHGALPREGASLPEGVRAAATTNERPSVAKGDPDRTPQRRRASFASGIKGNEKRSSERPSHYGTSAAAQG